MATDTHVVHVPEGLYRRLERLAALTRQPLESLVEQALSSSIPPLPDDLPPIWRDALIQMETLSDAALWDQTRAVLPDSVYAQLSELREKRREGTLSADEARTLDDLQRAVDLLTLKKAYAAVLLKWRGQRLPSLSEVSA